jgi:predicted ester cyclase
LAATGRPIDEAQGKQNVRAYWEKALERIPDLHFEIIEVLAGVDSIAIYYDAVPGKRAVELLIFNKHGKVARGIAHYNA